MYFGTDIAQACLDLIDQIANSWMLNSFKKSSASSADLDARQEGPMWQLARKADFNPALNLRQAWKA